MIGRRHLIGMLGAFGVSAAVNRRSQAATTTGHATRMLVGFAPGGSVDVLARLLVEHMKSYSPSLVIENRPGAGGRLALEALRNSPPDGSTLLLTPGDPVSFSPHVHRTTKYQVMRDFIPVAMVASAQFVITLGPRVPDAVSTIEQFAEFCRSNSQAATFGTPGAGSRPHFIGTILAKSAGFPFVHVPYNGAAPAIQDLLRGEISATVTTIANVLPYIQAGTLRALVTTAPSRSQALATTPTMRESNYPNLEAVEWFGVVAPPGTPPDAIGAAQAVVTSARQSERVRDGLTRLSFDRETPMSANLAMDVQADIDNWEAVIHATQFRI